MEKAEAEKTSPEDGSQLNRNRSFKSKQLVRSQAIRESQSPPRTISPSPAALEESKIIAASEKGECLSDECEKDSCDKKQQVEIQITSGAWESDSTDQRLRARRWLQRPPADLLSNNPRVACVCGACAHCPHCRGRRRRHICTIKQDSGIACSEDCPDCSDTENTGHDSYRKSESVEYEEQTYYCRCPERKERPKNISLTRTDSDERSEPTGPELVNFIKETLNKNARDRMTLLKIEKELHALVSDTGRCVVRFPVMSSYGRMLVHRAAALFQLSHHLDHATKTAVLVSKTGTSGGRIPCTSFKQWCTATFPPSPHRSILKRDTNSLDEPGSGAASNARSKSLEQRERDYERMKRRIFTEDNCSQDEPQWPWLAGPVKLLTPDAGRNKLIKVHSLECSQPGTTRGPVSKSHSFGGYAAADPHPRVLSRQGDLASSSWRLSPSSSGYKTLSLRSTDSVTPSPTGGASPEPCLQGGVVCAVTDMGAVPPGALVINPQTGRPLTNPDGSLYHFDPANPPVVCDAASYRHEKIDQNNEKKRGKLEKQHSFIDNECECQPSEESRNKCCCACRRHEVCHRSADKPTSDQMKPPPSPSKTRYEQTDIHPETTYPDTQQNLQENVQTQVYENDSYENYENFETNQLPQFEETNQTQAYEASANQRQVFEGSSNQRTSYEVSTNQRPPFEATANQRQGFEASANHRQSFDASSNQRSPYEHSNNQRQQYEVPTNQRQPYEVLTNQRQAYEVSTNQRPFEANQNQRSKMNSQESQECYQPSYGQMKNEEVTSPPIQHSYPQDMNPHQRPAKTTPLPLPDPHIRPVSLTNMAYPPLPQGFPYMNQFRMDPTLQHLYHHNQMVPGTEDHKLNATPPQEPTFRIDPSYPYAAVDFAAQCGACVDPNTMRSYNMPYGQVEVPQVLPTYPMSNVMLQHIQMPYQEAVQWQPPMMPVPPKLVVPELYPVYPNMYQYNMLYPPVIPQHYPLCQPVYGMVEKPPSRSNSVASANANVHANAHASTFANAHSEHGEENRAASTHSVDNNPIRRDSNEIAAKIQQIKDQMAQLNTRDRPKRDDWKRRNNGNGILGNYPNQVNGRIDRVQATPTNDETQLSSAARAIVNSIRSMQAKTNNYQDRREYQYRPDYRRRERDDRLERDGKRMGGNILQYRPPYLLRQMSPGTWCRRSPGPVHPECLGYFRKKHEHAYLKLSVLTCSCR